MVCGVKMEIEKKKKMKVIQLKPRGKIFSLSELFFQNVLAFTSSATRLFIIPCRIIIASRRMMYNS
jgi:hypothetical protein